MRRSDVTALFLSLGEASAERARASVRRQTLPPAETVAVDGVRPFSAALRAGVRRISTPFFVQVDADMVLDPFCFERLRAAMAPEVGIAVGQLRDPLMGTIAGVKLFRRACCDDAPFRDSVSPDTDFYMDIATRGWLTLHVLAYDEPGERRHTCGEHDPAFTPGYTYATYYLLGCRYIHRSDLRGFLWRLDRLRRSTHAMATVARVALCAGLFGDQRRDVAKSSVGFDRGLVDDLAGATARVPLPVDDAHGSGADCERFYARGRALSARGDWQALVDWLAGLGTLPPGEGWIAEASLCRGFVSTDRSETASTVLARLEELQRPFRALTVTPP